MNPNLIVIWLSVAAVIAVWFIWENAREPSEQFDVTDAIGLTLIALGWPVVLILILICALLMALPVKYRPGPPRRR